MPSYARWYFDVISPFAYLQLGAVRRFTDVTVQPVPVLFAGLLAHHGQLGPAEIPAKRRFTYRYVTWAARKDGIALRFPPAHPFNPLPLQRLCIALGADFEAVQHVFDFVWRDGSDPVSDWPALCRAVGLSERDVAARIAHQSVKDALRSNTERAIEEGVFGVPTLVVDGELFWGADASAMAADYIRDRTAFDDPAMRALDTLPEAASRVR